MSRPTFTIFLLAVNESDRATHQKMGLKMWETKVEIIATAAFFEIPVYILLHNKKDRRLSNLQLLTKSHY